MDNRPVWERLLGSRKVWVALASVLACVLAIAAVPAEKSSPLVIAIGALGSAVALAIGIEDGGGKGPTPPSLNGLLLVVGLGLLVVTAGGCQPIPETYLAADRATFDAVAPEYDAYVDGDSRLTLDQRRRRHRTVDTWRFRLDQNQGRVPAASP